MKHELGRLVLAHKALHLYPASLDFSPTSLPPCADELWAQLGELGIDREAPHPAFGRTAELLKTFCARR